MKNLFIFFIFLLFSTAGNTDIKGSVLSKTSDKISEYTIGLIPGEGITEFDIQLSDKDDNDPRLNLLLLRNLNKTDKSNFFTQMILHTQDVGVSDLRYIGNFGLGYRMLSEDNSYMFGGNIFYDRDLANDHARASGKTKLGFYAGEPDVTITIK